MWRSYWVRNQLHTVMMPMKTQFKLDLHTDSVSPKMYLLCYGRPVCSRSAAFKLVEVEVSGFAHVGSSATFSQPGFLTSLYFIVTAINPFVTAEQRKINMLP